MALEQPPYVLQSASHPAFLFRQALQSLIGGGGVVGVADMAVTAGGAMSVNVAAGQSWTPGTLGAATGIPAGFTSQGSYYGYNDGVVNLAVAASNSTNPRIDVVCCTVQDSYYAGAANQAVIQVVTGTPAATPAAPAAPASSIVLANVLVPAASTSIVSGDLTDMRPFVNLAVPLRENPAGRLYLNSSNFTVAAVQLATMFQVSFLYGAMTTSGGTLIAPVAGLYLVGGQLQMAATSSAEWIQAYVMHNGAVYSWGDRSYDTASADAAATCGPELVPCAAGDSLGIGYKVSVASTADANAGQNNFLVASLVSQ